jgi:uncharacterized membrane protein
MIENLLPGVSHLQNIHPLVVHYPIAFLTGAALFYALAGILRNESLSRTAFSLLIVGALSAAVAAGTGLYAEEGVMVSRSVRSRLLDAHESWMIATLCVGIGLAVWAFFARPFPKKGRLLFAVGFAALIAILTIGADYGGRMVYDYNAGGSACSQPIEFTK